MRKPSCFLPAIKILLCFSSLPEPATPRFSASPFPCPTFLLLSHAGNQRWSTPPQPPAYHHPSLPLPFEARTGSHGSGFLPLSLAPLCPTPLPATNRRHIHGRPTSRRRRRPLAATQPSHHLFSLNWLEYLSGKVKT
uniref:Uncharacterized protein n=1 Tax=Opuntia streptacantha TaxID=393608 RepID=A0A7C8Z3C5_OPUST